MLIGILCGQMFSDYFGQVKDQFLGPVANTATVLSVSEELI